MLKRLESKTIAILVIIAQLIYILAIIRGLNSQAIVLSLIFIILQIIVSIAFIVHVMNNWALKIPKRRILKPGFDQKVAVIIPTWNEPVRIVEKTILSVLQQDYSHDRILIILTDDAKNPEMKNMLMHVATQFPSAQFIYNIPPEKNSPQRKGEGKAGNLNSALDLVSNRADIQYIETRDADDIVGVDTFLRDMVGQIIADPNVAFVQTIKRASKMKSDPFGNQEENFYQSIMLYKNEANAVFPCGSGLVWRKEALLDIGGFPSWNLVEDFQSGAEALRRGWKGLYVPIVGAVGQVAPEDIPNLYKQRGTWAIDSFRFLFWGDKRGLNWRQKLHFAESAMSYFISILAYFYAFLPAICLIFKVQLLSFNSTEYLLFEITHNVALILFIASLAKNGNVKLTSAARSLQIMFGLFPVYLSALITTLRYGKNRKPKYKVTRKTVIRGIYLHYVLPQLFLLIILAGSIIYHLKNTAISKIDFGNIAWPVLFILIYSQIIRISVYGAGKNIKNQISKVKSKFLRKESTKLLPKYEYSEA